MCFFYNKSKILTILFIVKYEKIKLFDEFLVWLGPIISRFFACSDEETKINKNKKGACSSPISMFVSLQNIISDTRVKSFIVKSVYDQIKLKVIMT